MQRIGRDYALSWDDVLAQSTEGATIGRPHIADALVARGHAPTRSEAFAGILHWQRGYYQPHYAPDPLTGVRLVREAGGVPVLAHPGTRGAEHVLPEAELKRLADAGLFGLEIDHRENLPDAQEAAARPGRQVRPRRHRFQRLPRRRQAEPARREHDGAGGAGAHHRRVHGQRAGLPRLTPPSAAGPPRSGASEMRRLGPMDLVARARSGRESTPCGPATRA